MDEKAKKLLDETGGMSFTDSDLPPDPMEEVGEGKFNPVEGEWDMRKIKWDMRKILRYIKDRGAEGYLTRRKEMEMIVQDTDQNIDEAISRLKEKGEIYEPETDSFRPVMGSNGKESTGKEVKKMREELFGEFGNEKKEEAMEGEGKGKEKDITDLTDEDLPMQVFEGERIGIDDILDETIVVRDMVTRPSSFSEGDYAILQVEKDGEPYVVITGSTVLMRQIGEKADKLPFRCRVIEQQSTRSKYRYYTLAPVRSATRR